MNAAASRALGSSITAATRVSRRRIDRSSEPPERDAGVTDAGDAGARLGSGAAAGSVVVMGPLAWRATGGRGRAGRASDARPPRGLEVSGYSSALYASA